MIELDGNAIGGELYDVFGMDMTGVMGVCTYCGAHAPVAEAVVYMRGPGTVARCRACHELHMVLVTIRDVTCVDISGLAALEMQ
ncbi:MAG: hypothetical protein JOY72_04230 [Actinobacteria bacterium]|nr:hypothetical protein [Actinomycetota bacterium]